MHRNAIILAAGTSSRFVPLSQEKPKALLEVKGEILIERQIRQLKEAGIYDICVVVGYKAWMFNYLKERFGVELIFNEDFERYNNTSSLIRVLDRLGDTYICSSDNYFPNNVFKGDPTQSYYSALYATGSTSEYCLETDDEDLIRNVRIGGSESWYMVGHVYFSNDFSESFRNILLKEYDKDEVRQGYWEDVFIRNIDSLPPMKINRYGEDEIKEFDTLDELREFDPSYVCNTRSRIIRDIACRLGCSEGTLTAFRKLAANGDNIRFTFRMNQDGYVYDSKDDLLTRI